MNFEIREESPAFLEELAAISIAFEVTSLLELSLVDAGLGGITFRERSVDCPYVKDYDAIPGNAPADWMRRFDTSRWGYFSVRQGDTCVGGAVVAARTPGVHLFENRDDLAILWDIRVHPDTRGQGIGSALFEAAEHWAAAHACSQLTAETQNINVRACRFYARQGCTLGSIERFAYPELGGEVELVWFKDLVTS